MKSPPTARSKHSPNSSAKTRPSACAKETLNEEVETDEKLTTVAEAVNAEANESEGEETEETEEEEKAAPAKSRPAKVQTN